MTAGVLPRAAGALLLLRAAAFGRAAAVSGAAPRDPGCRARDRLRQARTSLPSGRAPKRLLLREPAAARLPIRAGVRPCGPGGRGAGQCRAGAAARGLASGRCATSRMAHARSLARCHSDNESKGSHLLRDRPCTRLVRACFCATAAIFAAELLRGEVGVWASGVVAGGASRAVLCVPPVHLVISAVWLLE